MVLAGAGVDHDELVRLGEKYFGGVEAREGGGDQDAAGLAESSYHGGEARNIIGADKARHVVTVFAVFVIYFLVSIVGEVSASSKCP